MVMPPSMIWPYDTLPFHSLLLQHPPEGIILLQPNFPFRPPGSPEYLGLGFFTILVIILIEIFGSPFLKNCSAVTALLGG